jgi:hypothetical protein
MFAHFDSATLKFWFVNGNCRKIAKVVEIDRQGDSMQVLTSEGNTYIVNFSNVTLIEEVEG